jgi:ribose-phosphate pyrophosphokinase
MRDHPMLVFTGNANPALAQAICKHLGMELGGGYVRRFPDGELDVKVTVDVRGSDTFIVQPTCPPVNENLMELLLLIDCLRRASAARINVILPYYGYARKDRKDEGRVPITAKLVANLITTAGASRVLALDLHATQIQGFFDIPTDHLFAAPVFVERLRQEATNNLVLVSPDVGGIKLAKAYAQGLRAGMAVVDKRRTAPDTTEADFFIGDVQGKNVLIVDDIIATGGSVAQAAALLRRQGARTIRVVATHGVFCGPAIERLTAAPIESILVTDSIPLPEKAAKNLPVEVVSVAGLLADAMRRIHHNESVSSLLQMVLAH